MGEETTEGLVPRPFDAARTVVGPVGRYSHRPEDVMRVSARGTAVGDDKRFMGRALELARSHPNASPNPKVGAVVVRDGNVIAEGVHRGPGTPHAEAAALSGTDAAGATLYVNLEPCPHTGRTPPCVPLILESGVVRVVAAISDPDPRVNGRGFELLRAHGVEVIEGVAGDEAAVVNAAYLHHRVTGGPYVTLKLAMTLDGALAAPDGSSRWITSEETRRRVHVRRRTADAVLVGAGTIVADDPRLTVRAVPTERQPLRVVVDASGRVPTSAAVFTEPGTILIATTEDTDVGRARAWSDAGAEVIALPRAPGGVDLKSLLMVLGERDCVDVLCEGGADLAASMLRDDLVDALEIHYGPKLVGRGGLQLGDLGIRGMAEALEWRPRAAEVVDGDMLVTVERRGH
jgi:diaminohydroxyphosphoribosylaminopyrimidine deaminase / 5-amino-6-(5-phosphoribosylamino)uracil reductase